MNMLNRSENTGFELAETQADIKKEPTKEALNLNGWVDASRFKLLVQNFVSNLARYNKFKLLEQYIQAL